MQESIKQFERLCLSYEGLLEKERFALTEKNFDYLDKVAQKKKSILEAMESVRLTIDFPEDRLSSVKEQFKHFAKVQGENEQAVEDTLESLGREISSVAVAQKNQSSVRRSYVHEFAVGVGVGADFKA